VSVISKSVISKSVVTRRAAAAAACATSAAAAAASAGGLPNESTDGGSQSKTTRSSDISKSTVITPPRATGFVKVPMINRSMNDRSFNGTSKEKGHHVTFEVTSSGIVTLYFTKNNKREEPFLQPVWKALHDDPELKADLRVISQVARRGNNNEALKQNSKVSYPWKVVLLLPKQDIDPKECSVQNPPEVVKNFLKFYNNEQNQGMFQYPTPAILVKNNTKCPPRPLDSVILDEDVIGIMRYLYADPIPSMVKYGKETLRMFWNNIEHGISIMKEFYISEDDECDDTDDDSSNNDSCF
jgi:hypothetical protein